MLWILLPLFAVMALAGSVILSIYGAEFRQGALWLGIVALACATNCFVGLAETVIMVQRPKINVFNSAITCVVAVVANLWLINSLGATGAALGILLPYVLLGALRHRTLRLVFGWERPWSNVAPPLIAAVIAAVPAVICRLLLDGFPGQILSAALFLLVFGLEWLFHFRRARH
jgi:O-antigen/teichoic acid export membrane protein